MEFVDQALARRLEAAEEAPQMMYARLYEEQHPEIGAAVEPICGGHMIFAGLGSPVGRATGLGFDGPVFPADLDRVEEFYRSHRAPAQVDICPLTDAGLLELLKDRGYSFTEFNNVLYRRLTREDISDGESAQAPVRPAAAGEAEKFAAVIERCFFPEGGGPPDLAGLFVPMFQMDGTLPFVAEIEGQPAACGSALLIPQHGVVALCGAGTLPQFRRRGLQTALIRARMAAAFQAGAEYAVIVTRGGTASQRNAERAGLRLAYSKATLVKEFQSAAS